MKKILVFLVLFFVGVPSAAGQVYISAVQTSGGVGHSTDDFVELFNAGAEPFDLSGVKLVKRTAHGTADTVLKSWSETSLIPGHGFYLWANSAYSGIGATPDATTSGSIADDNGIALRLGAADTGQILGQLAWGEANDTFAILSGNIPTGSVLQRQSLFDENSSYEIVSALTPRNSSAQELPESEDPPTNEEEPPVIVEPPIIYLPLKITEILPNPAGTDEGNEAVELYNPNNTAVDITGWYLGDGLLLAPASNALQLAGSIPAHGHKSVVIPSGKFALNNTGGETVQLFSPAKSVVDSITYTGTALENQSFQDFEGSWSWQVSSLGSANLEPHSGEDAADEDEDSADPKIIYAGITITEFYPALGEQFAGPMVELANTSKSELDLAGWQVDVAATHLKKPSDSAVEITGPHQVPAAALSAIALTNLNSTDFESAGKYWVILYSPDGKHQDAVNLKNVVSGMSFGKIGMGWQWTTWSHAVENKPFVAPALKLTEILPAYKDAEEDAFAELNNPGTEPIYLGSFKFKVGAKAMWLSDYVLQPGEYLALSGEDLPAALTPSGKKVQITDANDKTVASASYSKGKDGLAYIAQADGKWAWSSQATPGAENVYKPAVALVKASAKTSAKPAAAIKPAAAKSSSSNAGPFPEEHTSGSSQNSKKPVWIFGILGAVLLGAAAVVWYFAKEQDEVSES